MPAPNSNTLADALDQNQQLTDEIALQIGSVSSPTTLESHTKNFGKVDTLWDNQSETLVPKENLIVEPKETTYTHEQNVGSVQGIIRATLALRQQTESLKDNTEKLNGEINLLAEFSVKSRILKEVATALKHQGDYANELVDNVIETAAAFTALTTEIQDSLPENIKTIVETRSSELAANLQQNGQEASHPTRQGYMQKMAVALKKDFENAEKKPTSTNGQTFTERYISMFYPSTLQTPAKTVASFVTDTYFEAVIDINTLRLVKILEEEMGFNLNEIRQNIKNALANQESLEQADQVIIGGIAPILNAVAQRFPYGPAFGPSAILKNRNALCTGRDFTVGTVLKLLDVDINSVVTWEHRYSEINLPSAKKLVIDTTAPPATGQENQFGFLAYGVTVLPSKSQTPPGYTKLARRGNGVYVTNQARGDHTHYDYEMETQISVVDWENWGIVFEKSGNLKQAELCLRRSVRENPKDLLRWADLWNFYKTHGTKEQVATCKNAITKITQQ
jgi:hypothetical protein